MNLTAKAIDTFGIDVTLWDVAWDNDKGVLHGTSIYEAHEGETPEYGRADLSYYDKHGCNHVLSFVKGRGNAVDGCEVVFESEGELLFYIWTQTPDGGHWTKSDVEPSDDEPSTLGEFVRL